MVHADTRRDTPRDTAASPSEDCVARRPQRLRSERRLGGDAALPVARRPCERGRTCLESRRDDASDGLIAVATEVLG